MPSTIHDRSPNMSLGDLYDLASINAPLLVVASNSTAETSWIALCFL